MKLSTVKWAQWDKTQSRGLFICVCIALCTIVAHNIAQNRPDNFPSYPPDNHHCSNDVYLREGGDARVLLILVIHNIILYINRQETATLTNSINSIHNRRTTANSDHLTCLSQNTNTVKLLCVDLLSNLLTFSADPVTGWLSTISTEDNVSQLGPSDESIYGRVKKLITIKILMPLKILTQVQSSQPPKSTFCTETHHTMDRSLSYVHPLFCTFTFHYMWNSLTADIVNSCSLPTYSYLGMLSVLLSALCPPVPLKSFTFWLYTNQIIIIIIFYYAKNTICLINPFVSYCIWHEKIRWYS